MPKSSPSSMERTGLPNSSTAPLHRACRRDGQTHGIHWSRSPLVAHFLLSFSGFSFLGCSLFIVCVVCVDPVPGSPGHRCAFPLPFCAPEPGSLGLQSHRPALSSWPLLEVTFSWKEMSPAANQNPLGSDPDIWGQRGSGRLGWEAGHMEGVTCDWEIC